MKNKCTGWFDSLGKCDWSECCAYHDELFMTSKGKDYTKLRADLELFKCVWSKCKPMAVIMFVGLTVIPLSYYYWNKYKANIVGVS